VSLIRYAALRRRVPPATVLVAAAALLLATYLPGPARAATEFHGRVVGIADGDTITVLHDGRAEKIRLYGIDAPEKGQAFGDRAKQFTSELAFGQTVSVRVRDHDRYRRTVGDVILPDGRSLNEELVRAGFAWWYRRYSRDRKLAHLEQEAREAHRGLWADPHPVPPWDFRRHVTAVLTGS
jgi:micrococcal nuclease